MAVTFWWVGTIKGKILRRFDNIHIMKFAKLKTAFQILILNLTVYSTGLSTNLVLKTSEKGYDPCEEVGSNSSNSSNVVGRELEFTILQLKVSEQLFPLKIKAFDEFDNELGESEAIDESLLAPIPNQPHLLFGKIQVQINLNLVSTQSLKINCFRLNGQDLASDLPITYKVFHNDSELTSDADIFQHADLQNGSNVLSSFIEICCFQLNDIYHQNKEDVEGEKVSFNQSYSNIIESLDEEDAGYMVKDLPQQSITERFPESTSYNRIYPNPVRHQLNFNITNPLRGNLEIMVFTSLGQRVFMKYVDSHSEETSISTIGWTKGTYYVALRSHAINELVPLVILE